jgi:hypothetical protein
MAMTRARIIVAVGAAACAIVVFTLIGVEIAFAIAWGVLVGILVLCTQLIMPDDPRTDAPQIEAEPDRRGTEISRMAWSLNPNTGMAGELITRKVRAILAHRLARHGVDVSDTADADRIDALTGPGVWGRLVGRGTTRGDLERALDAIDRLSPTSTSSNSASSNRLQNKEKP